MYTKAKWTIYKMSFIFFKYAKLSNKARTLTDLIIYILYTLNICAE